MSLVNKLTKLKGKIILLTKRVRNRPDSFMFVSKDKKGNYVLPDGYSSAMEVGEFQDVVHLTFHDMDIHAISCKMTDLRYLNGLNANAVYIDPKKFERLDTNIGKTYFQPVVLTR